MVRMVVLRNLPLQEESFVQRIFPICFLLEGNSYREVLLVPKPFWEWLMGSKTAGCIISMVKCLIVRNLPILSLRLIMTTEHA